MNELQDTVLKKPLDRENLGMDRGAVDSLVGFLNNPNVTGADVPRGVQTKSPTQGRKGETVVGDPVPKEQAPAPRRKAPTPIPQPSPAMAPLRPIESTKFVFTGRLRAGKDFAANAAGTKIFGFAEPLYFLQEFFFGSRDKNIPGARSFLQTVGQWGWGCESEKYPLSPARAIFIYMIRALGPKFPKDLQVDWENFGRSKTLWVDAAFKRIDEFLVTNPEQKVSIVNARFEHEFTPVRAAGWDHWHVMCSPKTWAKRLAKDGLTDKSPSVADTSEDLARGLDADVIKRISAQKYGPRLKVIWNDEEAPAPSPRLYTLDQFLACVNMPPVAAPVAEVSGE